MGPASSRRAITAQGAISTESYDQNCGDVYAALADGSVHCLPPGGLSTMGLRGRPNWPNIAALAVWLLSVGLLLDGAVRSRKAGPAGSRRGQQVPGLPPQASVHGTGGARAVGRRALRGILATQLGHSPRLAVDGSTASGLLWESPARVLVCTARYRRCHRANQNQPRAGEIRAAWVNGAHATPVFVARPHTSHGWRAGVPGATA